MSWAVGYDSDWHRDIGYGVPATCDQPGCGAQIDRGLAYVCGGEPRGGETGCGLYFCGAHLRYYWTDEDEERDDDSVTQRCERCGNDLPPFDATPDVPEWITHKLTDPSWAEWRAEHPEFSAGGVA